MMKLDSLRCALWVCGLLALEAGAAEAPAHNAASVAAANMGQAATVTGPGRDARIKAGRPAAQESTRAGPSKGDGSSGHNAALAAAPRRGSVPPRAANPLARSNADRLHSLHPAMARGRIAPAANRRVAPMAAAASGNMSARGRGLPAARVPPTVKAMARGSMIGGPRAAGPGRLGGPATGRTANRR
jgi:hypothetical protein